MVLHWDNERYQKIHIAVSLILVASIAGFMYIWFFYTLPTKIMVISILPVGIAHWYSRKLDKLFKVYGNAQVAVDKKTLTLTKKNQQHEAAIRFHEIIAVESTHWLFLNKMKVILKNNREVLLVNLCDHKLLEEKINSRIKNKSR